MSLRRIFTDTDRFPRRPLKIIAISVAVLLTAVCGGGGWTPRTPRVPSPPPPDLSVAAAFMPFWLSPDGIKAATFRAFSGIAIYDWQAKGRPIIMEDSTCLPGGAKMKFSPDGSLLAYIYTNGTVQAWKTGTGRKILASAPGGGIADSGGIAWSRDGHRLAAAWQGHISVWDVAEGKKISDFQASDNSGKISALAFTRDGGIYSSDSAGWVRLWSAEGKLLRSVTFNGGAWGMLLSPDEKEMAVIQKNPDGNGMSHEVVLWDSTSGLKRRLKAVNADLPELVTFSPNGKLLVLRIKGGTVSVFSTLSNQYLETLGPSYSVRDVVFRPDGTIVAIVGREVRTFRCCGR